MEDHARCEVRSGRRALAGAVLVGILLIGLPAPASSAPTPSVTIGDVTVTEGNSGTTNATFTIQASPPPKPSSPLQVSWATAAGTATAPGDFSPASGTVTLTKTVASRTVSVPVVGDLLDEANETFVVNLSNLVGSPGAIGDAQGVATITDDDALPALSVNDTAVSEGNTGTTTATFTISLSAPSGRAVSVNWATTAGTATAGTDYASASGSRTIAAGSTSATVGVTVNGDTPDEDDETFGISLSGPTNATLGDAQGVATITDDDALPALSVADVSAAEGNVGTQTFSFVATLSAASGRTVTVQWATEDDEALGGSDFTSSSGTLTFLPGDTSETASVSVSGDVVAELDEVFAVVLTAPTNASIADGRATGTIVDDEGLPVIDLTAASTSEGDAGPTSLVFTVSLSNPSALPVTVDWTTLDGSAVAGSDYDAASGTVTFAPLDTIETVVVDVTGDVSYERDETMALELSNATNAPIGRDRRFATIGNDDAPPVVSIGDGSLIEANSGTSAMTFTVTLSAASEVDAVVAYATSDGTATVGDDYVGESDTLTIPAGETSAPIQVAVIGDARYEADETFSVTLAAPIDASIGDGTSLGTIVNDDPMKTTLTLKRTTGARTVTAKGILESTRSGHRVTVTLYRARSGRFVAVASKTVRVKELRDRDGDGKTDGTYLASFTRPTAGGSYKLTARFLGTSTHKASSRSLRFRLSPR